MAVTQRYDEACFVQAQLAALEVTNSKDDTDSVILAVSVGVGCNVDVDDQTHKRVDQRLLVVREDAGRCLEMTVYAWKNRLDLLRQY